MVEGKASSLIFHLWEWKRATLKLELYSRQQKSRSKNSKYVKNKHTHTPTTKLDNGNGIIGRGPPILLTPSFLQIYPTILSTQSLFLPCFLASPQHHLISHVITGPNPVWPSKSGAQKKFSIFLSLLKFFIVNRKKKINLYIQLFK